MKRIVSHEIAMKIMHEVHYCMSAFNSRKVGKNPRHSLQLESMDGFEREDGLWEVNLGFVRGRSPYLRIWDCSSGKSAYKFQKHQFRDFRKLMRLLAKGRKVSA